MSAGRSMPLVNPVSERSATPVSSNADWPAAQRGYGCPEAVAARAAAAASLCFACQGGPTALPMI